MLHDKDRMTLFEEGIGISSKKPCQRESPVSSSQRAIEMLLDDSVAAAADSLSARPIKDVDSTG
jgi:hypothetical protein